MKIGDKYICIKDYNRLGKTVFKKGYIYNLIGMNYDYFHARLYFRGDDSELYWFVKTYEPSNVYIENYFESISEVRRKKLEKLEYENR